MVVSTVATPWERNASVVRLTRAITALDKRTAKVVVDAVLELGRMLGAARDELPHGEWLRWLAEGVRMDVETVRRYIAVHEWSHTRPRDFARFKDLSISKLYRLLKLQPQDRRRLHGRRLAIPGSNERLTLDAMTLTQLDRVIRDLRAAPPSSDPVPKLLQGARSRFAGLQAHCDELIEHQGDVDPDAIAQLHEDLLGLAERLESTFDL